MLIELAVFSYYSSGFLRLKVKMKYFIKCELLTAATLWVAMRASLLAFELARDCHSFNFLLSF